MLKKITLIIIATYFIFLPRIGKSNNDSTLSPFEANDTIVIQNDTLIITDTEHSKSIKGLSTCSGKINGVNISFIGKTNNNSDYSFCIGADPKRSKYYGDNEVQMLTILLLMNDSVTSALNFNSQFPSSFNISLRNPSDVNFLAVNEVVALDIYQGFCGGFNGSIIFFRRKNKLIKGTSIAQYGEFGTEYFTQRIVKTKKEDPGQFWIENEVGKENTVYFTEIEKYEIQNDSLVRINPKRKNIHYVTAKNGLVQRSEPSTNGESLGLLPYKTKVNVLNQTNIEMTVSDGGKQIEGHWVQIEYKGEQPYDHSFFVFDAYLSKTEPK